MKLRNKRALVTGSSRSIGREIAKLLALEGARVVVNARGSDVEGQRAIEDVVREIRAIGGWAKAIPGSVESSDSAQRLIDQSVEALGGIDILINNAGIYGPEFTGPVTQCSDEVWRRTLSTNLDAVFYTCRAALPHMVKQKWGRIINAGSVGGTGQFGGSAYTASKSALFGLGRGMAADYGPYGITVNTYNPEAHATKDTSYFAAEVQRWLDRGYVDRGEAAFRSGMGGAAGVAPWIAYLCTDEAASLNGQVFAVDARRIALLGDLGEDKILFRDAASDGPWSVELLTAAAPLAFPVQNRWPARFGDDMANWERCAGNFVPNRK